MKKTWTVFILCFLGLSTIPMAHAQLNIEITQGMLGEIPIAITTFEGTPPSGLTLASIIKNDLGTSGRFKTITNVPNGGQNLRALPVKQWQDVGAENVVFGTITPQGNNLYTVSFDLVDTFNGGASPQTLVRKSYENVRSENFRALAHHMSDIIYQTLTGVKGAFSTRIAYILVNQASKQYPYALEIADADGYNPKTLVLSKEPMMSPAWSPDGKRLAFVSFEKKQSEIYIIDVGTGRRELIARFPGINGAPNWSFDNRSLAVVLSKDGSPKIYTIDLLTKQLKNITQGMNIDTEPAFEPDGRSLLFTSNRGGQPQIYRIYLNNNSVERVTFKGNYNARPRVTQDGKKMVMIHQGSDGRFHIASQNLQTGEVSILTHSDLDDSPSLSPNGAMILYGTSDTKNTRRVLGMVTIDGRNRLRLPARQGNVQEPAWSPYLEAKSI